MSFQTLFMLVYTIWTGCGIFGLTWYMSIVDESLFFKESAIYMSIIIKFPSCLLSRAVIYQTKLSDFNQRNKIRPTLFLTSSSKSETHIGRIAEGRAWPSTNLKLQIWRTLVTLLITYIIENRIWKLIV